jgi:hypothetical protein
VSVDVDLFVEQAIWLGPRLRDPSRLGVVNWLGQRLEPEARRALVQLFPLMHPVQVAAENAVCQLLARAIVVQHERVRRVDVVTRSVDWPATYANSFSGVRPPLPYLARLRHSMPDRACLNALATLAQSWSRVLELAAAAAPGGAHRIDLVEMRRSLLQSAITPHLARGLAPGLFNPRHAARLRALDDVAAVQVAAIEKACKFWSQLFGTNDTSDADRLRSMGRFLHASDAENIDTLLEATVALSVARAAEQAERADWPTEQPWIMVNADDGAAKYPAIRLRSNDLNCEISKGTPFEVVKDGSRRKIADLLSPWADEALRATGKPRSRGRQPDLILAFWLESRPHRIVFVLGDAKRNATGDGEPYLRGALEVAATYLMSFGYRMGLQVPDRHGGPIVTALNPGVTIFCRQNTGRDAESAVALFRANRPLPVVMAFDVEQHFAPSSQPWHAPVLAAWLGSLGRQALRLLAAGDPLGHKGTRIDAH